MSKTGAKKTVSKVQVGAEKEPSVLTWKLFEGRDGAIHCRPVDDGSFIMRAVGKVWRPNPKAVREMERRRAGRIKGSATDAEAPTPTVEPLGDAGEEQD